jgi:hypothetical protein
MVWLEHVEMIRQTGGINNAGARFDACHGREYSRTVRAVEAVWYPLLYLNKFTPTVFMVSYNTTKSIYWDCTALTVQSLIVTFALVEKGNPLLVFYHCVLFLLLLCRHNSYSGYLVKRWCSLFLVWTYRNTPPFSEGTQVIFSFIGAQLQVIYFLILVVSQTLYLYLYY